MIKIKINVDSIEGEEDTVKFGCDWDIVSDMTESEEYAAKVIIKSIQNAFEDLSINALVCGGSVERDFTKGKDEKE